MKILSVIFAAAAVVLSDVMCAVLAYNYRDLLCGIQHAGFSAPVSIAFLPGIPYSLAIAICAALAITFRRKAK